MLIGPEMVQTLRHTKLFLMNCYINCNHLLRNFSLNFLQMSFVNFPLLVIFHLPFAVFLSIVALDEPRFLNVPLLLTLYLLLGEFRGAKTCNPPGTLSRPVAFLTHCRGQCCGGGSGPHCRGSALVPACRGHISTYVGGEHDSDSITAVEQEKNLHSSEHEQSQVLASLQYNLSMSGYEMNCTFWLLLTPGESTAMTACIALAG